VVQNAEGTSQPSAEDNKSGYAYHIGVCLGHSCKAHNRRTRLVDGRGECVPGRNDAYLQDRLRLDSNILAIDTKTPRCTQPLN